MDHLKLFFAGMLAVMYAANAFAASPLHFQDAFVRATPLRISAGYIIITNPAKEEDQLTAVTTPGAGKVEIHQTATDAKGIVTMQPVTALQVPAQGRLALRPGGTHIMLYQLKHPLQEGQKVTLTLHFAKAGQVPVVFTVRPITYKGKEEKAGF